VDLPAVDTTVTTTTSTTALETALPALVVTPTTVTVRMDARCREARRFVDVEPAMVLERL